MRKFLHVFLILLILASLSGCARKEARVEGYRVVSYDSTTGKWVIIRNGTFDGKYLEKRLTVICDFYQWGDREAVTGSNACNLRVGQMMVPNPFPQGKRKDFLDIWEMSPDRLSITEGYGPDRVRQQFVILKAELI